jgi:hypothetical protein
MHPSSIQKKEKQTEDIRIIEYMMRRMKAGKKKKGHSQN